MIIVNNMSVITNEKELEELINFLEGEAYNDLSKEVCNVIADFLREVWKRDTKLMDLIHKKISRSLYPIEMVDLSETGNWENLEIMAISKNKAYREKKADIKTFNGLADLCFKGMKPLYDRLVEIEEINSP